jgi:hypothetical protein
LLNGSTKRLEGETLLPHMLDRKVLQYGLSRDHWQRLGGPLHA